jgi:hypothetical protein
MAAARLRLPVSKWGNSCSSATEAIEKHVLAHSIYLETRGKIEHVPTLTDLAAQRLASASEADSQSLEDIPSVILPLNIGRLSLELTQNTIPGVFSRVAVPLS